MIKLSIIVPVYGVEQYIEECIASLLVPGRDDYEIIVVNDGTKDRSIDIINDRFRDPRLRIFNQENAGQSSARNHGIREARGEYVWFFDSDDWAETNMLPDLFATLTGEDVISLTSYFLYTEATNKEIICSKKKAATSGIEHCYQQFYHHATLYIYKREQLLHNNCFFVEGIVHEDSLFASTTLPLMKSIKYFNSPVYHYRQRKGSTTMEISPKRIRDMIFVINSLIEYGETNIPKKQKYNWGISVTDVLHNLLKTAVEGADNETNKIVRDFVNGNRKVLQYLIHSNSFNNRMMGVLSYFAWGNLFGIYSLLYKIRY